jgi:hypothetical protein
MSARLIVWTSNRRPVVTFSRFAQQAGTTLACSSKNPTSPCTHSTRIRPKKTRPPSPHSGAHVCASLLYTDPINSLCSANLCEQPRSSSAWHGAHARTRTTTTFRPQIKLLTVPRVTATIAHATHTIFKRACHAHINRHTRKQSYKRQIPFFNKLTTFTTVIMSKKL